MGGALGGNLIEYGCYSTARRRRLLPACTTYTPAGSPAGRASAAVPVASAVAESTARPSASNTWAVLPGNAPVSADVLDEVGRPVQVLAAEQAQGVGPHTLYVTTAGLAAGLYTVRLTHDGAPTYRKLMVE